MNQHRTLPGRSRNSTIPKRKVEISNDFLTTLAKEAGNIFSLTGMPRVELQFDDPLIVAGIMRSLKDTPKSGKVHKLELTFAGKPEPVEVEVRDVNTFRVTRIKLVMPTPPAIPPPKKR